jgi:hypothetical protein
MSSIKELVDRIIEDGVLSPEEHAEFIKHVTADGQVDREESEQIKRVFQLISEGKLKVEGMKRS